eukprot:1157730-Pelagomonas_calceolata.AAC.8
MEPWPGLRQKSVMCIVTKVRALVSFAANASNHYAHGTSPPKRGGVTKGRRGEAFIPGSVEPMALLNQQQLQAEGQSSMHFYPALPANTVPNARGQQKRLSHHVTHAHGPQISPTLYSSFI